MRHRSALIDPPSLGLLAPPAPARQPRRLDHLGSFAAGTLFARRLIGLKEATLAVGRDYNCLPREELNVVAGA